MTKSLGLLLHVVSYGQAQSMASSLDSLELKTLVYLLYLLLFKKDKKDNYGYISIDQIFSVAGFLTPCVSGEYLSNITEEDIEAL